MIAKDILHNWPYPLVSILLFTLLCKWLLGLNSYSGFQRPPLHGDFEAQRHWLEITLHLPRALWYRYDLDYWGLDYPPLTALHSLLLGKIANSIQPAWVALDASRGLESETIKIFMRLTVLVSEYIILVPPLYAIVKILEKKSLAKKWSLLLFALMQPCLNLIDHGHFQYNGVMLGFSACAFYFISVEKWGLAAVSFSCSLLFKQMALFYALPIFFYLLSQCKGNIFLFLKLALCTSMTFGIIFALVAPSISDVYQIFHRVFPVSRGLYEDKVANIWCAISILFKIRSLFNLQYLVYISMLTTLAVVLPSSIHVFLHPQPKVLLYGLVNSSLGFFLCSFQVHEKSILLPAFFIQFLLFDHPQIVLWFNNVAVFSMLPLLYKDGLLGVSLVWTVFVYWLFYSKSESNLYLMERICYLGMFLIYTAQFLFGIPSKYPDIYTILNVELSTTSFVLFLMYFNHQQFKIVKKNKRE